MSQTLAIGALGAQPGPTFSEPFEMLEACHQRVIRTLALLERLRTHVAKHGADAQAREAAADVIRYFDEAAPQHHRDEEFHVFPALLAQADTQICALVARLRQDHLQMEARWQGARRVLQTLTEARDEFLRTEEDAALDAFASLYAGHIEVEERLAYPAARSLLDPPAVAAMGREMAQRRGARP